MFNNVDGKGFENATKEIFKIVKELKQIIWFGIFVLFLCSCALLISAIAPEGLVKSDKQLQSK